VLGLVTGHGVQVVGVEDLVPTPRMRFSEQNSRAFPSYPLFPFALRPSMFAFSPASARRSRPPKSYATSAAWAARRALANTQISQSTTHQAPDVCRAVPPDGAHKYGWYGDRGVHGRNGIRSFLDAVGTECLLFGTMAGLAMTIDMHRLYIPGTDMCRYVGSEYE
jgi:hypothetical protein